jgi:hypothetical protein
MDSESTRQQDRITAEEAKRLIEPGWNQLLALIDGIPEARAAEPGVVGDWSIDILMGHIAFWERNATRVMRMEAAGEVIDPIDPDPLNAEAAEEDRKRSHDDLRKSLDSDHELMLSVLEKEKLVVRDRLGGDTWDHYPEHFAQIEAWRTAQGFE